jgi:hypothetical protein
MKKLVSLLLAFFVILSIGSLAFASDVSDANYYGVIRATNSGTATSNVCANVSINTTALIASGFLDETSTNAAVRVSSTDVDFMPGYNGDPWIIHYDSIGQNSNSDVTLYTGNVTGGKIVFFPDPSSDGLTIPYDPSLALGNNFEITINNVFLDTDNGTDKSIISINGTMDVVISDTVPGNITVIAGSGNITQTIRNGELSLYNGVNTVAGQHFTSLGWSVIEYRAYLKKTGAPPGNISCKVWNVAGAELGTIGTMVANDLTGAYAYYTFTGIVDTPGEFYVGIEYALGGVANSVQLGAVVSNECIGNLFYGITSDAITNEAGQDSTFYMFYAESLVSISGISCGEHSFITISGNTTDLKINVDGTTTNSVSLLSIPDYNNDLIFFQNGSALYAENITVSVGGTPVSAWAWEYGDTFHDLIGDNDGTPVFRTASSDPDVSAELLNYKLVAKSTVDDDTALVWPEIMEDPPDLPETMYTDNTTPGFFFAGIVHTIAEFSEVPEALFWYNFAFTIIIIIGILVYYAAESAKSSSNGTSSKLFLKILIQGTFLCIFALPGLNIYGFFVPLYYIFFSSGVFMLAKDFGW